MKNVAVKQEIDNTATVKSFSATTILVRRDMHKGGEEKRWGHPVDKQEESAGNGRIQREAHQLL